jgi:hypothetical protein
MNTRTIHLTRVLGKRMLSTVQRHSKTLRAAIALVAALVIFISAPLHAAHNHGDTSDPNRIHAPCAICQMQTPACGPLWEPCPGVPLDPIFILAAVSSPTPVVAPTVVNASRAPPFSVA